MQVFHQIFLHLVGNILPSRKEIFLPFRKQILFAVKPMFSDVGDTNISATMFLTFDKGFSLKKNI